MRSKGWLTSWMGLMLFWPMMLCAQQNADFWHLEEYYETFPQQKKLSQDFAQRVKQSGQPLAKRNEPIRIFVVYPGHQVSDYWRRSIKSFTARLDELNVAYQIYHHSTRPAVAIEQQKRLIKKALRYKTDYFIFTLDVDQHQELVSTILLKSNMKLILQNITTPFFRWQSVPPFMYVGFDHFKGTELLSQYYQQKYPQGKYSLVYRSPGYISQARGDSFIALQTAHGSELVASEYTDASLHGAKRKTYDMLQQETNIDYIYACSTDVAFGVRRALERLGLTDKIAVNGWGGGEEELKAILDGELDVTVMRMSDDNGVAMAEGIALDLQGKKHLVPQVFSGEFKLVTKATSPIEIEQYKRYAFRYSSP